MKVVKWFDEHFEDTLLVIFLILISFVSLLQIIARKFFGSLPWPEEFDRYCWIWTVFISLPYTIRKGNMLRVNVLVDLLPSKVRNAINLVVDAIIGIVMFLLLRSSFTVIQNAIKSPGFTIIPTLLFIDENGRAKLDICLARGKHSYDKRETLKEKEDRRAIDRQFKHNY
jgi:TRAP-type C4-dicarboxylate transport system permease small subunit